jgi:hypothetical protein
MEIFLKSSFIFLFRKELSILLHLLALRKERTSRWHSTLERRRQLHRHLEEQLPRLERREELLRRHLERLPRSELRKLLRPHLVLPRLGRLVLLPRRSAALGCSVHRGDLLQYLERRQAASARRGHLGLRPVRPVRGSTSTCRSRRG